MGWTWIVIFWISAAALAYTLVGYGVLVRLLARWLGAERRDDRRDDTRDDRRYPAAPADLPTVTLIIPAHNEQAVIQAKLENALASDYPRHKLEILVASDGSSDRTVEIARSFGERGVRTLAFPQRRGKTSALMDAVGEATGEVFCITDANVMFRRDALRRLVSRLNDPRVGAASGDVRLESKEADFGAGEEAYYRIERGVQKAEARVGSMMGVDGGMYVLWRRLFQPIPPDTILDDFVISMRVIRQGKRVAFEPDILATENATATSPQEFQRRVRLSAGAMQVLKRGEWPPLRRPVELWQFVSHKLIRWAGPVWLVLLAVSSVFLWNAGPVYRIALAAQVVFYLLAAAGLVWPRLRRTRIGGIAFYFAMSHAAMGLGLMKGLFNLQYAAWNRTERTRPARELEPGTHG